MLFSSSSFPLQVPVGLLRKNMHVFPLFEVC